MSYPAWWDTQVTIYNKYEDPQTQIIKWYKTVIDECFWKNNFQRLKLGDIEVNTDGVICRIKENSKFLEKQDWVKLPNDEMSNYFTLSQGDIIIRGNVSDNIDEYTSGIRSSDIIEKYKWQGCIVIDMVVINTGVGRGLPHYHVEGV